MSPPAGDVRDHSNYGSNYIRDCNGVPFIENWRAFIRALFMSVVWPRELERRKVPPGCDWTVSHLFDAVRVNSSLRLQYADWFGFLGALRHLPYFLCDKVVDTIQGFNGTLYQTDTLCCSCDERRQTSDQAGSIEQILYLYQALLPENAARKIKINKNPLISEV